MINSTARVAGVLLALAVSAGLAGCATASPAASPTPTATATQDSLEGSITVFAAASLKSTFTELAEEFEAAHPGTTVELNFAGSADLVTQIAEGAPADVFASADEKNMAKLIDAALVDGEPVNFATNVLEIAVPPDNPGNVHDINDLGRTGLKVVLCAETVPCGKAADATFKKARVVPSVVSREVDVKATLAKVKLGEADAAVVYHSDVVAANGAVTGVPIRDPFNTSLRYPIITLADDASTAEFVAYVLSPKGLATLQSFGLGAP